MHSQNNPGYSSQSQDTGAYYTGGSSAPSGGYYSQQPSYQSSTTTSVYPSGPSPVQTHFSFFTQRPSHSVTYSRQHHDVYPEEICCRII